MPLADSDRLPSSAQIADKRDLDGACAIKHFHRKTLAEAEQLFATAPNTLTYTEDLLWMRPVGFRYYIRAAIRYALSERATGECDLINGIASTLALWHEQHPGEIAPCASLLADFCSAVVQQFERYNANPEIYTGLREQYHQLADTFTRLSNATGNA